MDYKQKYKEALANARQEYNTTENVERKQWLEEIFPELCESEDEKIRKALIYHFQGDGCICTNEYRIDNKDIRAWLEKQGESIKIKKGKNYLCTKTHKYAGVEWIEGVKYYSPEDYSLVNQGCTCYCPKYSKEKHNNFFKEVEYDGCLEKQGEQKPFDYENANIQQKDFAPKVEQNPAWSEEDESYLNTTIAYLKDAKEFKKTAENCIDWLKSLKDRIQPQLLPQQECEIEHIEHGKYYYCIKDYYSGGRKRASKGEVVQALRGMSMMALGAEANKYFIPVKCVVN